MSHKIPPHHAFPGIGWPDLEAEIRREIVRRREAYPRMVDQGKLTRDEAKYQVEVFEAILEDCGRFAKAMAPAAEGKPCTNPLKLQKLHGFTWHQRRGALSRELEHRVRMFPSWIRTGKLKQDDADRHMARLSCMRAIYELGYDWTASNAARPHFASFTPTDAELDAREQWHIIETDIAARDGQAQEALAL